MNEETRALNKNIIPPRMTDPKTQISFTMDSAKSAIPVLLFI